MAWGNTIAQSKEQLELARVFSRLRSTLIVFDAGRCHLCEEMEDRLQNSILIERDRQKLIECLQMTVRNVVDDGAISKIHKELSSVLLELKRYAKGMDQPFQDKVSAVVSLYRRSFEPAL